MENLIIIKSHVKENGIISRQNYVKALVLKIVKIRVEE